MSSEERVYTINLGKALLSQSQHRAVRAINMIREFASRHMGAADIKIDEDLAHQIWARGARHPPRKVRVRMWTGSSGEIIVSRYDGDAEPGPTAEPPAPAEAGQEPEAEPTVSSPEPGEPKAAEPGADTETAEPATKPDAAAPDAEPSVDQQQSEGPEPKAAEADGPAKPDAAAPEAGADDQPEGRDAKDRGAGEPDKKD